MGLSLKLLFSTYIFLIFLKANSDNEEVKQALVTFMEKLAPRNAMWGWNLTSDPCIDKWYGVSCNSDNYSVRSIVLDKSNLIGVLDATSLCLVNNSLQILSLSDNMLHGLISEDIGNCKSLTHLFLNGNEFSCEIPISIAKLSNLKRLRISDNFFTGELPNVARISGLISFLAENNSFTGGIPVFDFSNLDKFNVSNNNLQGPIPNVGGKFNADSFYSNPDLCGKPLSKACAYPPSIAPFPMLCEMKDKKSSGYGLYIYSGYIILGAIVLVFISFKLVRKFKTKEEAAKKETGEETIGGKVSQTFNSNGFKSSIGIRSEYSMTTSESGIYKSSLVVLSSPGLKGLNFEDLLSCPAELVRRGKHGSLYKVMVNNGVLLAVKRIRNWGISKQDFEKKMELLARAKHPHVLSPVAYYFSEQEKLLAYEYLQNGSLFMLLYGPQSGQFFDWGSRLKVAANIAKALAYMHEELHESGIAHGNLKSSNILFDKNMDPGISEYGLVVAESQDQSFVSHDKDVNDRNLIAPDMFKDDVYAFGVILLELLTGKVVKNDGFNLVKWVKSVVSKEWSVEVFDKSLILQDACEQRMIDLLQVALKCINPFPDDRPSIRQVAMMTSSLKEDEQKSISFGS
ncbi:hypothetical protein TanjilG_00576 [Lupinus angustifolius]|uniref:Protein kinase domain-containing protein n=1 Tax=Lupinus angustifolius TaxID=3871 RepID=A0A394D9L0_LUPAN|nr:PREDICTED: probable inactive receptor kinase At2g26730 [Lupinus angustifolius]OIW20085.1 hypothetical protein TanjilG_00576 [Lupinus angustifolius]